MISNKDRRNGIILSGFNQKAYGKFNNKKKAKYDLNDLVLDLNKNADITTINDDFDISNDSFKISDDEEPEAKNSDEESDNTMDLDSDVPYGKSHIINISISDNEDSDVVMSSPAKSVITPKKGKPLKNITSTTNVLSDISPIVMNTYKNEIAEKRISMNASTAPPLFQRNNSNGGLTQFRNRSSLSSTSSKRWSMLSFNNNDDSNKENIPSVNSSLTRSKRFSTISTASSTKDKLKRLSISSNSTFNDSSKTKRFSMTSQLSTTSSTQSSFTKYMNKVGNAISTVSVSSNDDYSDTSGINRNSKEVIPGVVGVTSKKPLQSISNIDPSSSSSSHKRDLTKSKKQEQSHKDISKPMNLHRPSLSSLSTPQPSRKKPSPPVTSQLQVEAPTLNKKFSQTSMKSHIKNDSDNFSVMSTNSSLRSSRSLFRLSRIFSSKPPNSSSSNLSQPNSSNHDNESIRSIKPKSSFNDFRKSFLSINLAKKESINDLKNKMSNQQNKSGLDKTKISLPVPHSESMVRLNERLKHSGSVLSLRTNLTVTSTMTTGASHSLKEEEEGEGEVKESDELRELVLLTDDQQVFKFDEFLNDLDLNDDEVLIKLAEASYSEVFAVKDLKTSEIDKVLKVIPIHSTDIVDEDQDTSTTSVKDAIQELKITKLLSPFDGFIKLINSSVVRGTYPKLVQTLWDDYDHYHESQNPNPNSFKPSQEYLILELEYGGVDLEKFEVDDWKTAKKIFWEIVSVLNNAETKVGFEHRDLHWGNIVIRASTDGSNDLEIADGLRDLSIDDISEEKDIDIRLIDFTLSRLTNGEEVVYSQLDNPEFFSGDGDYQYDMYRYMKKEMPVVNGVVDWKASKPVNNVYWIHYVLDKLIYHKNLAIDQNEKDCQDLLYLHKSLDPRRKRLNNVTAQPDFKKFKKNKKKKRNLVYFKDFENSHDVLTFGDFYRLR